MKRKLLLSLFLTIGVLAAHAVTINSSFGYFSATFSTGCTPSLTTFNVVSAYPGSASKKIKFEPSSTSITWTGSTTSYTYTVANTYDVYVDYFNSVGSYIGYDYVRIEVYGQPGPVVNLYGASGSCPGDKVRMEVSQGWNPSPDFSYAWNWGDGSPIETTSRNDVQHVYASPGVYNITVTATGGPCGGTYSSSGTFTVSATGVPLPPYVSYNVWVGGDEFCPNQDVYFGYPEEFAYEFIQWGDGQTSTSGHIHEYTSPGTYYPQVTITNGCGASATYGDTVQVVTDLPWSPSMSYDIYYDGTICSNEEVRFSTWIPAASLAWYSQDGTLLSNDNYFEQSFINSDSVYLVATNGCGFDTTIYAPVQVVTYIPVNPDYVSAYVPSSVCIGDGIVYSADYFDEPQENLTYSWDFGDGGTSSTFSGSYNYASSGTYTVTLLATNTCGQDTTISFSVNVGSGIAPDASSLFYFAPAESDDGNEGFCVGDSVLFVGMYYNPSGTMTLDFGDGNTSSSPELLNVFGITYFYFTHAYNAFGTYNTSLTYTNSCGLSITKNLDVMVGSNYDAFVGAFYDEASNICLGDPINFYGYGVSQFIWDFGDGTGALIVDDVMNPIPHVFENPGNYTVTIQGTNGCGNSNFSEINVFVPDNRINITTNTIDAQCGEANGKAIAVITGGAQPYNVTWSNGSTDILVDDLTSGIYVCNVTDQNGCYNFGIATVSDAQAPAIVVNTVLDVTCNGGNDGVIDINVIGSSAPYSFDWSNGSTTEDQAGLVAGPYEVYVTDAYGCIATASINVDQPDEVIVSFFSQDATCGNNDGGVVATANGNSGPYTYVWNTGSVGQELLGIGYGIYEVNVIDSKGCVVTKSTDVDEDNGNGGPAIAVNSVSALDCSSGGSTIDIAVVASMGTVSYDWSNGATTQDITVTSEGLYTVTVLDSISPSIKCHAVQEFEITHADPSSIPICMVSVDSMYSANKVIWEKPVSTDIKEFKIYRESSMAGLYYHVGTVPYDSLSIYTDVVANPQIQSWRYKISTVDNCGAESALSEHHKTIHLNQNLGLVPGSVNLIWDDYEGFGYATFNIVKYTSSTGYQTLASVSALNHSYTDPSAPLSDSTLFYLITIDLGTPCVSTRAQNNNTVRSNRTNNFLAPPALIGISEQAGFGYTNVYPNPANTTITVEFETSQSGTYGIQVVDALGNLVQTINCGNVTTFHKQDVDISQLERGVYFVNLVSAQGKLTKRIIKL